MIKVENKKKILLAAITITAFSQIYLGFSQSDFRVSAGIIAYTIALYNFDDFKPIPMGIISAILIYIARTFMSGIFNQHIIVFNLSFGIEMVFYISYSIIYHLFIDKKNKENLNYVFFIITIADFISNTIEILIRSYVYSISLQSKIFTTILLVAVLRSTIVWIVLYFLKNYKLLLMKEEHEKRYRKLLGIMSQLKTEAYWMEKNMQNIEDLMVDSYKLYELINSNEQNELWKEYSLNIARNIHEIKKENALAIRGILDVTEKELKDEKMKFSVVMSILYETMTKEIKRIGKNINLHIQIDDDFYTEKHYYLMSIFRNLFINSIEAIPKSHQGDIYLIQKKLNDRYIFTVRDNGIGIDENEIDEIFSPGFSTKINYETGEVSRGLGLTIVKKIVEEELKGEIRAISNKKDGTEITITVLQDELEV